MMGPHPIRCVIRTFQLVQYGPVLAPEVLRAAHAGVSHERRDLQQQLAQVLEDTGRRCSARDREGGATGARRWAPQGQRKAAGQRDDHDRRAGVLARGQKHDRAGIAWRDQSTTTPLALIGAAHFWISSLTNWPRYCG